MEDYTRRLSVITRAHRRGRHEGQSDMGTRRHDDESKVQRNLRYCTADFETGERSHEPRNTGGFRSWNRQENRVSPRTSRRN